MNDNKMDNRKKYDDLYNDIFLDGYAAAIYDLKCYAEVKNNCEIYSAIEYLDVLLKSHKKK